MPLTDDFSYKLGDNGVILNPDSVELPFVDINKVIGLDNAPYRTTERDHEGTDGGFMDAEFEKGRSIVLEGVLYSSGNETESYLDSLKANYAPSRVLIPFYFKKPGVDERLLFVKPLGCRYDVDQLRRVGQAAIQFSMFAEDPRIYSSNLNVSTVTTSAIPPDSGRSYSRAYNYGYTAIDSNQLRIIVGGNRPTPPVMTITGPTQIVAPIIVNDTLGISMKFDVIIPPGSTLTIDAKNHTVRLNGQNRRSTLIEPNWFFLTPGDNYMRIQTSDASSATLNVQYRDAWR